MSRGARQIRHLDRFVPLLFAEVDVAVSRLPTMSLRTLLFNVARPAARVAGRNVGRNVGKRAMSTSHGAKTGSDTPWIVGRVLKAFLPTLIISFAPNRLALRSCLVPW